MELGRIFTVYLLYLGILFLFEMCTKSMLGPNHIQYSHVYIRGLGLIYHVASA